MPEDAFFVSTDRALLDVETVCRLLADTYWAGTRSREVIVRSLGVSVCFGLYRASDRRLVGFTRVVTDHATVSWVCDVVVDPEFRGRGLGTQMMAAVVEHPCIRDVRSILATRDAHGLYEKFGYRRHEMMRRPPQPPPGP